MVLVREPLLRARRMARPEIDARPGPKPLRCLAALSSTPSRNTCAGWWPNPLNPASCVTTSQSNEGRPLEDRPSS